MHANSVQKPQIPAAAAAAAHNEDRDNLRGPGQAAHQPMTHDVCGADACINDNDGSSVQDGQILCISNGVHEDGAHVHVHGSTEAENRAHGFQYYTGHPGEDLAGGYGNGSERPGMEHTYAHMNTHIQYALGAKSPQTSPEAVFHRPTATFGDGRSLRTRSCRIDVASLRNSFPVDLVDKDATRRASLSIVAQRINEEEHENVRKAGERARCVCVCMCVCVCV
jgi:hypothetical protein